MRSVDFSRSERLSDQVRAEISLILRDEVKDPRLKGLTIIRVELSDNLNKAKIFFSSVNSFCEIELEDVLSGFDKAKGYIRSVLGKRLFIKRVPELFFEEDKLI